MLEENEACQHVRTVYVSIDCLLAWLRLFGHACRCLDFTRSLELDPPTPGEPYREDPTVLAEVFLELASLTPNLTKLCIGEDPRSTINGDTMRQLAALRTDTPLYGRTKVSAPFRGCM